MFLAINEIKDAKLRYSLIVGLLTLVSYLMFFLSGLAFGLIDQNRSSIDHWRADTVLLSSEANKTIGLSNLKLSDKIFIENFENIKINLHNISPRNETIMVEYSSPNTNKPLHLGHIRNNLLGFSVANILEEDGYEVIKTQIINDRGIHICKSMLAWEKYGNGETPESTATKGDKLVGNYYVEFDKHYKNEIFALKEQGEDEETAKKYAPSIIEAQKMLLDWENARRWPEFTPAGWDLLIFIHSFIREGDLPNTYLYAAMNGYSSARCASETVRHVKEVLHKRDYLFKFCRLLEPFHFVDTEAAVKSFDFIHALKTE